MAVTMERKERTCTPISEGVTGIHAVGREMLAESQAEKAPTDRVF
jgi:hypothetical protein